MLYEKFYMVFTHLSAGKMWSSICMYGCVKPALHYQINLTRFLYQICTFVPNLKKIQKIYKSRNRSHEFCWHQHFFTGN